MGLVLLDGMEDQASWAVTSGTNPAGRNGNCLQLASSQTAACSLPTSAQSDTWTVGFAFKITALGVSNISLLTFYSDAGVTNHVVVRINTDLSVNVFRGGNLLQATLANYLVTGVWYYLELQAKLHDTTGFYTLKFNGATALTATNVDTKNVGTKTVFDTVQLGSTSGATVQFDDLYLQSGTSDLFLGDLKVETLYPNGNGGVNQWLGSDADSTNNYLLVNETGTPVVSSYTTDPTVGHQDLYTLTDLVSTSGMVLGVCHAVFAEKTDSGARDLLIVNHRASDTKSAAVGLVNAVYQTFYYPLVNDPETSAAWTIANVNALTAGVETA